MKSSLEKVQEELELQPPAVLTLEDTDAANGVMNGHAQVCSEPGEWPAALRRRWRWGDVTYFRGTLVSFVRRVVFFWGGVYKICGEKFGLMLFPSGCDKKLDRYDSELFWGEVTLTMKFRRRGTWQIVFLTRGTSRGFHVIKESLSLLLEATYTDLYICLYPSVCFLSLFLWQWALPRHFLKQHRSPLRALRSLAEGGESRGAECGWGPEPGLGVPHPPALREAWGRPSARRQPSPHRESEVFVSVTAAPRHSVPWSSTGRPAWHGTKHGCWHSSFTITINPILTEVGVYIVRLL